MSPTLVYPTNRAFGGTAAWANRLAPSTPIITSDLGALPQAFVEAVRRRKRGERFSASVFIDDPRACCAVFVAAPAVLAQVTDHDQRAGLLDAVASGGLALGGRSQRDLERYDSRSIRSALEFLATADVVVTRSGVERERLCQMLGRYFLHMTAIAPLDPLVPTFERPAASPRAIVVWAPTYQAEACGLFAYALEEFQRPAIIICAPGQPAPMREGVRFVGTGEAAAALAQAAIILDTSMSDPGAARALARWNVPLAVASCSGAVDWLDGVTVFDPWNHRSITAAVANALGYRAPRERRDGDDPNELARAIAYATPPLRTDGPLVSVIVPTMNRRKSLQEALDSIFAQTYPRLEILVVNDGGEAIDPAAIRGHDELRLIEYSDNRGVSAAVNIGIEASHGKYIAILADDDLFCPDHLARLVDPLERTGGSIAHALELGEHFDRQPDGAFDLIGNSLIAGEPATATTLKTGNVIGGPSIMFTRDAYNRVGPFDERAGHLMDLEMWMRMAMKFDFIHVDRVIAVMSMRNDNSQASAISGAETAALYRRIYDFHPTLRPLVASARERQITDVEAIPIVRTLPQLRISP